MTRFRSTFLAGVSLLACCFPLAAQEASDEQTLVTAERMDFDENTNQIRATGRAEVVRGDSVLLADEIVYSIDEDLVLARGNVTIVEDSGSVLFLDEARITGDLKDGFASEVRVLFDDQSRLAGREFRRAGGILNELLQAVYTACDQTCETEAPIWQIKAGKIVLDEDAEMVRYTNARVELGGIPVFYTPYLAHPDPSAGRKSGLLFPSIRGGQNLGFAFTQPIYWNIAPDKDATISPLITTEAGQGLTTEYRQRFQKGEMVLFGSGVVNDEEPTVQENFFRGHFTGVGTYEFNSDWRLRGDINVASDETYLRRYGFGNPTWLNSNMKLERFTQRSYFSADLYYFQVQRANVDQAATPVVSPLLNYRYTSDPGRAGGYMTFDASTVALWREEGTDSARLTSAWAWTLPYTGPMGDVYKLKASVRGDGYYIRDQFDSVDPLTNPNGFDGFRGRVVPELSMEWRYPLVSAAAGFSQTLEPIVQGVVSPIGQNTDLIPNEDSRDFEFDDTNLFESQRFTGFDRVEGGFRFNYGLKWAAYDGRGGSYSAMVGQTYRFHEETAFADGSGLRRKFSDFVGRVSANPNPYVNLQYRFRFDKDSFNAKRSELTGVLGPPPLQARISYLFIDEAEDAPSGFEDREELFVALSSRVSKYWSINGSHRQNLGPGGGSIRTSGGFKYEDECFTFGVDVIRDNTSDRDFESGYSVLLRFSLKTIGDVEFVSDVGLEQ